MESKTVGQKKLAKILNDLGFDVIEEYQIGIYYADCYLPSENIVVEFDGPIHGLRKKKDKERDWHLVNTFGVNKIVRLKEKDIATIDKARKAILDAIGDAE